MASIKEKRIYGLDVFRALAILLVIVGHTLYFLPEIGGPVVNLMNLFSFMGVELFFVLSGFLIGGILYKEFVLTTFSYKSIFRFWIRRWFRTLPNYYLVLGINCIVFFLVGYQLDGFNFSIDIWKYLFFLQNFSVTHIPFFPESWSLSVEEYAYLIAPLALVVLINLKLFSKRTGFLLTTLGIIIVFLVFKLMYNSHNPITNELIWNKNLKAIVIYRIDAIFYGFLATYFMQNFPNLWKDKRVLYFIIGALGLIILHGSIQFLQLHHESNGLFYNVFYLPLNSMFIMLLLPYFHGMSSGNKFISNWILRISKWSYSMYLLHYTIVLYAMYYFSIKLQLSFSVKLLLVPIYFLTTIGLSYLCYTYWEKPMMELRDRFYEKGD